jgi:predicted nucleic acid-binding protein
LIAPDTSVLIAAVAPWHRSHPVARDALRASEARLVSHVAFETTSALSRMPEGLRIAPAVVLEAIVRRFPETWLALDAHGTRLALEHAVAAGRLRLERTGGGLVGAGRHVGRTTLRGGKCG